MVLNYAGVPGPIANLLSPVSTILDAFFFFFMTQVWDLLVSETNTYGMRVIPSTWVNTCEAEMKAFLGLLNII